MEKQIDTNKVTHQLKIWSDFCIGHYPSKTLTILMSMHDYNTEVQPAPVNLQRGAGSKHYPNS